MLMSLMETKKFYFGLGFSTIILEKKKDNLFYISIYNSPLTKSIVSLPLMLKKHLMIDILRSKFCTISPLNLRCKGQNSLFQFKIYPFLYPGF